MYLYILGMVEALVTPVSARCPTLRVPLTPSTRYDHRAVGTSVCGLG